MEEKEKCEGETRDEEERDLDEGEYPHQGVKDEEEL